MSSDARLENPLAIKPASTLHGVVFAIFVLSPAGGAANMNKKMAGSSLAAILRDARLRRALRMRSRFAERY
jgi:hypothetical protein